MLGLGRQRTAKTDQKQADPDKVELMHVNSFDNEELNLNPLKPLSFVLTLIDL